MHKSDDRKNRRGWLCFRPYEPALSALGTEREIRARGFQSSPYFRLIATGCSPSYANGVQTSSIFSLVMAKITSPGFAFFDLAYCPSDHRGVLVAALHEEPLGNVENLLDRLLRVLIACHGHLRPCYRDKHTMSGVRVQKGWRQKSPTAVTASLETRPTMDGEPER